MTDIPLSSANALALALLISALGASGAGCKGEASSSAPSRTVRPTPVISASAPIGATYKPLRVRPRMVPVPEVEANAAQRALIFEALKSEDVARRRAIATQLNEELGAIAVAQAIPRSVPYPRYSARLQELTALSDDQRELPYTVMLPRDYDPSRPWPMHIDLHGGGTWTDHRNCLKHFNSDEIADLILLCPTTFKGHWWLPEGESHFLSIFADARRRVHIDSDRVSLGGLSNGGNGTWHLGHKYPGWWAALVPRCAGRIRDFDLMVNLVGIPVLMIHGALDPQIPADLSRQMLDQYRQRRMPILYREVEEGRHEFFPELNHEVLPWLATQRRAMPAGFTFEPTRGTHHGIVHWIELSPPSRFQARLTVEQGESIVDIQAQKAPQRVTIYLNDAMVDLDKPVRVKIGGREHFAGTVERDAQVALNTFRRTWDAQRIFTARVALGPQTR